MFQFELNIYKTPVCENPDFISSIYLKMTWYLEIANFQKISIKVEIISRNAFLLCKIFYSTFVCQQIHNVYILPKSSINCFNLFQNFNILWYKDLKNQSDLHKINTIKLTGFSWWVSICLWELQLFLHFFFCLTFRPEWWLTDEFISCSGALTAVHSVASSLVSEAKIWFIFEYDYTSLWGILTPEIIQHSE